MLFISKYKEYGQNSLAPDHFEVADSARLGGEAAGYLVDLAMVIGVFACIAHCIDLCDSFVSGTVELVFKDIDIGRCLHHAVGAPFGSFFLVIDSVAAYHPHEQIDRVLEIAFLLPLVLVEAGTIRNAGEESCEGTIKSLQITI